MSALPWSRLKLGMLAGTLTISAIAFAVQPPGRDRPRAEASANHATLKAPARSPRSPAPKEVPAPAPFDESPFNLSDYHASPDDIKPRALVPIPDDPPPHEGAMIQIPYVIECPDVVRVEVLQAAPGRPIQGPRMVRMDGTISLDFYGEIAVTGLTAIQVKEKLVLHLRKYLKDTVLGLVTIDGGTGEAARDGHGKLIPISPADSEYV